VTRQTPHVGYVQMAVTIAAVIENVCSSRRQKTEHVTSRTCIQTLASFALLVAQNLIKDMYIQSDQNLISTVT
jgi:hypothetical protein